jgi:translation initiation factor 1
MNIDNKEYLGTVYSTGYGRMCPDCGQPIAKCECTAQNSGPKGGGTVRVGRETKGRKGKGVTVITGLPLGNEDLQALASQLKRRCGAGGTLRDGVIEIQGDHRDALTAELIKRGFAAKKSGG